MNSFTARQLCCKYFLAQNFAKDASKTGQEYADEGMKQGQKLGEKAYEVGKDKGNIDLFLTIDNHLIIFYISS